MCLLCIDYGGVGKVIFIERIFLSCRISFSLAWRWAEARCVKLGMKSALHCNNSFLVFSTRRFWYDFGFDPKFNTETIRLDRCRSERKKVRFDGT